MKTTAANVYQQIAYENTHRRFECAFDRVEQLAWNAAIARTKKEREEFYYQMKSVLEAIKSENAKMIDALYEQN